ncbi:NUDIX domain-containing protein [Jatrophihabitans sp. YIM 134969]
MAERTHRVVCGALVRGDEVLLVHRHPDRRHFPGVWDLPGGHVEPGEEPVAALRRELREELGVTVTGLAPDPAVRIRPWPELDLSAWPVATWTGEHRNLQPDEHDDLRWWPLTALDTLPLPGPWDVHTLRLLAGLGASSPARRALLAGIAGAVGPGPVRIGIDGVDGAGKTRFADDLAVALRERGRSVVRVRVDDFLFPSEHRYRRGRGDPEGFFLDSFDHDTVRRTLLDPHPSTGDDTVLLVDGLFLQREELAGAFDLVVFLDVPFEVTAARMAVRDGTPADPGHPRMRRYVEGQRIYFARCRPRERADVVIEHSDPLAPVVVRSSL